MKDIRTAVLGLLQQSKERRVTIETAISELPGVSRSEVSKTIEKMLESGELYNPRAKYIERAR